MERIPPLPLDQADSELLAGVRRLTGSVSNLARTLAWSPASLRFLQPLLVGLQREGAGSRVSARHKELGILRVSLQNGCHG